MIVRVKDGKKFQHDGIRIELVGSIGTSRQAEVFSCIELTTAYAAELFYDRGNRYDFVSLSQELAGPGEMRQAQTFDFTFKNVEKQYESYSGINVKLRYGKFRRHQAYQ